VQTNCRNFKSTALVDFGGYVMLYAVAEIIAILRTPETKGKNLEN
jgi:hypothetical protein